MKRFSSIVLVIVLLALGGIYLYLEDRQEPISVSSDANFKPKVNSITSPVSLPNLNENEVTFAGNQTKLQLVNFWASWCGPCIIEAPDLVKLHNNYADKVTIYAVNSTKYDREREARSFVEEHDYQFDVLFDRDGILTDMYMVNTYPTSFIIDQEGIIRERINGVISYEEWERIIAKWSK